MAYYFTKAQLKLVEEKMHFWRKDVPVNRDTILSFIEGTESLMRVVNNDVKDNTNNSLSNLMLNHLSNEYEITALYLDHSLYCFAYRNQIEWEEAFLLIFDEFQKSITWKNGYAYLPLVMQPKSELIKFYPEFSYSALPDFAGSQVIKVNESVNQKEYTTFDGIKISIGSKIQLSDKWTSYFEKTFNKTLKDEGYTWKDFKPSTYSFNHVRFF